MLGYVLGLLLGVTAFADTPCPDGQTRDAKVCDAQSLPRDTKTQCCAVSNKVSEAYDPYMEAGLRQMFTLFDTDKDEEHQRGLFQQYDADGSGSISPSELSAVMKQIGSPMSDVEIQRMVKEADQDGDGLVNFPEFLKMMT